MVIDSDMGALVGTEGNLGVLGALVVLGALEVLWALSVCGALAGGTWGRALVGGGTCRYLCGAPHSPNHFSHPVIQP